MNEAVGFERQPRDITPTELRAGLIKKDVVDV
jgi:hypothetical protein